MAKQYTEEQIINIIKEYFYMDDVEKAKELFETYKERFTDEVLHKMDMDNFKMESLRKDSRLQYIQYIRKK